MRFLPLLFLLTACKVFDPSLLDRPDAGEPDAGTDLGTDAERDTGPITPDAFVANGCDGEDEQAPPRPTGDDSGDQEMVIGLHSLLLNQDGDRWRAIGRNLDNLCSLAPVPMVECQPRNMTASPIIDGDRGIDNVFGGPFYEIVDAVAPDLQDTVASASQDGIGVIVVRIRDWNGEDNDPRVDAMITQSVYGFAGTADQAGPPPYDVLDLVDPVVVGGTDPVADRMPRPNYDGFDWLFPRDDTFFGNDPENPRNHDPSAYVADGVLVISLPDRVTIRFASTVQGVEVILSDAQLHVYVGESHPEHGMAEMSGRWGINDLLETARGVGICPGQPEHDILTNQINTIADVLANHSGGSNDVMCDALSLGVRWTYNIVRIGSLAPGPDLPDQCSGDE